MYCLDTNIIIFFLKNNSPRLIEKFWLEYENSFICTTSITAAELLYYSYKNKATKSLKNRKEFLQTMQILDFDFMSADIYAFQKAELANSGNIVDDLDLQIASICISNRLILATNNTKDFERINDLQIEDWTQEK